MKISIIQVQRLFIIFVLLLVSCKKEFLDKKPSTSILQPTTIDDFQFLLENIDITRTSALGILAGDEYTYRSYALWQSAETAIERNSYIWAKDIYGGQVAKGDWSLPYKAIFYSNNILAGLDKIEVGDLNKKKWNYTKGWALFVRANAYYDLVRNFAPAYDVITARTDLGVPLRLDPSIGEILQRSSVFEVYQRIIKDLNDASSLLEPDLPVVFRNRPSKIAAYALEARIYLNMRDYTKAELSADSCLSLYDKLVDYNSLNLNNTTPFSLAKDEVIYYTMGELYFSLASTAANTLTIVSPELISLYKEGDLRLMVFFQKQMDDTYLLKRNVSGVSRFEPFTGLATDEVYLVKAECAARRNDVNTSMGFLNKLLIKRYAIGQFNNFTAVSGDDALMIVLRERRKELVFRGLRWDDLKRLNKEGLNIKLTRELNGEMYIIEPNSPRYTFPIPDEEINLSGIKQNQR